MTKGLSSHHLFDCCLAYLPHCSSGGTFINFHIKCVSTYAQQVDYWLLRDLPVKTNGNFKLFIFLASELNVVRIIVDIPLVNASITVLILMEQVEIVIVVVVIIVRRIGLKNCWHRCMWLMVVIIILRHSTARRRIGRWWRSRFVCIGQQWWWKRPDLATQMESFFCNACVWHRLKFN